VLFFHLAGRMFLFFMHRWKIAFIAKNKLGKKCHVSHGKPVSIARIEYVFVMSGLQFVNYTSFAAN
jgi:hypothetical protein